MKLNNKLLQIIVFITLSFVMINQIIWIVNMYKAYQQELFYTIETSLEKAIHMEVSERLNSIGGPINMRFAPLSPDQDSSDIIERTLRTEDTTIVLKVNKNDPDVEKKLLQYAFIKISPINIDHLNNFLKLILIKQGYSIRNTYIEYFDLKSGNIIKNNKPNGLLPISMLSTSIVPLDILKSIGVKAYIATSPRPILKKMWFQIALSGILMLIASYCLILLLQIILRQRKFEKMRQDFVNTMVHEFKRPISNASAMIEMMPIYIEKNDKKKVNEYLEGSLLEFKKLTAYTDRIQRISNNESDHIILEKSHVQILPFFEKLKFVHTENHHKTVIIDMNIETNKESIFVDVLHFSNVMDNLIENAIKYSDNEVRIDINVKEKSGMFEISVTDDGIGISDKNKKLIFEKFYRVDNNSTMHSSGFGLGLTYVKAIVGAHGGAIHVFDAKVKGSKFVINLPI